ncbi:hypothetical protein A8B82_04965 [Sulfitobacter sp. EhC04]|nr:hypothetical protein A8B82_04965 [Sulfitobacter sp. EhC04]
MRLATLAACLSLPASLSAQNILEAANDAVIRDQLCVGTNCANAQTFIDSLAGSLMLRDTRTRIDFEDASDNVNFPGDEWSILINDIFEFSSGGINHFSVQNRTDNTTPLRIEGGAPNNAIYTNAAGQVGLGTSLPQSALHVRQGAAPGVRLEAAVGDGDWLLSSTFSGFAIYDMDGGPTVPLWLENGAPSYSLFVNSAGFVGFGTNFPEEKLHIRTNAVDTDAFALFDANGSGSDSAFRLRQNGVTPTTWEFRNQQDSGRLNVGIAGG